MPLLELHKIMGRNDGVERPEGHIGTFPDEDGTYRLSTGDEVTIEMNPPEAANGLLMIALTSVLFEGHQREAGYVGKSRRVVQIGKKGSGSTNLSAYETLKVTLLSSPVNGSKK